MTASLDASYSQQVGETEVEIKNQLETLEKQYAKEKYEYEKLISKINTKNAELEHQIDRLRSGKLDDYAKTQVSENVSLQKKIKDLEDEIEDLEDDMDSLKKKMRGKDQELLESKNIISEYTLTTQKLEQEISSKRIELSEKEKELGLRNEALSFVQEILSAKKTSEESVSKLYSKIDSLCDFISGELEDTITKIITVSKDDQDYFFHNGLSAWAATAKKEWIQGKTTIAFVGEFSAGKTSIVNRILSQDNPNIPLLPVSTKATTAIPTYVSGRVFTSYNFVTPRNELKTISESTFKKVSKEVLDQVHGLSSLIQYFVMSYKNQNLEKLSILDTPGFNSNDTEDAERTIGVINECDALFWVFDVNAGTVNRTSIELIHQNLRKPLFIIINKVDTKSKSEVDKVETLIKSTLQNAGIPVEGYIRFSSKAPLSDIMNPIKEVKHDTTKESFLQEILDYVGRCVTTKEKDATSAKRNADKLLGKSNMLRDRYNDVLRELADNCDEAVSIPHFETYWIKKNRYEMSQEDYQRMSDVLEIIRDDNCGALCDICNELLDVEGDLENAWNDHSEKSAQWRQLSDCNETLKKKVKSLSN